MSFFVILIFTEIAIATVFPPGGEAYGPTSIGKGSARWAYTRPSR